MIKGKNYIEVDTSVRTRTQRMRYTLFNPRKGGESKVKNALNLTRMDFHESPQEEVNAAVEKSGRGI